MQTPESAKPIPLSALEDLFWRAEEDKTGAYRVAILFRVDGCIEADLLTTALEKLQQRHPKLRAVIGRGIDGRPCYQMQRDTPPIPFEILDFDGEETPWREETRRLLQLRFPSTGPLAALTILRSRSRGRSELLLTAHHAIADGLSAIMLVDNLLVEYANAEAHVNAAPLPALRVVTAARAKQSAGLFRRLRLIRRIIRLQREEKCIGHTPLPQAPDIPPQSQWERWVFSRAETVAIVQRCRKEQTSLGGAMIAAVFCGLIDCMPESEARFRCQFPFDLRGVLTGPDGPVTTQDVGCFVTLMSDYYQVQAGQSFWDLARSIHRKIQWFTQQEGPAFNHNATSAAVKLMERAPRRLLAYNNTRVTLLATNYGVLNLSNAYGSLHPRECTLMFKNDVVGPVLVLEALVMAQRLIIGFAADELDPAFWEQLHVAVHKHLKAATTREALRPLDHPAIERHQEDAAHQRIRVAPQE